MEDWVEAELTDSSENEDTFDSTASVSDINTSNLPRDGGRPRVGRQNGVRGPTRFNTGRISSARSSIVHVSSTVSTHSSGSEVLSYTSSTDSIAVSTPYISASEARNYPLDDSILQNFVPRTPPTTPAASPPRQTSRPSSISSSHDTSDADESNSCGEESRPEQPTCGTPATSNVDSEDDNGSVDLDQEVAHRIEVLPTALALHGLDLQNDHLSSIDVDSDFTDLLNDIESIKDGNYAKLHTVPWAAGTRNDRWPTENGSILASSLELAHAECHSRARTHRRLHEKIQREERQMKTIMTNSETRFIPLDEGTSCIERPEFDWVDSPYILARRSTIRGSRIRRTSECHDSGVELFRVASQQSELWRAVDCTSLSVETLGSAFFPEFAFSHLTPHSLENFASELAPCGLICHVEYNLALSLGFGPPMNYYVCAFDPRNKKDLQTYRKLPGRDGLHVEESLPIAIDLFDPEVEAKGVDAWLDKVIDSDAHLQAYLDLMQRKKKGSPSVQVLMCLVSWYTSSKDNPLKQVDSISRDALKLLMTTTLLTLVPKMHDIPESLSRHLSPQPALYETELSHVAPKLLTRQIKASIHHLQRDLLQTLFCYLACDLQLVAEVKVAIALLIAFVLELAQKAGRDFAKFATTINERVKVKQDDVRKYESNMQTHIFDRLRDSVSNTVGELGQLGHRLKSLGSIAKGKSGDHGNQDCQYVQIILNTVL